MKKLLSISFLLLLISNLRSQEQSAFLEFGGSGGWGSVNYEWWKRESRISYYNAPPFPKARHVLRVGIGFSPVYKSAPWNLAFPAMYHLVYGNDSKSHRLELGGGFAPVVSGDGDLLMNTPFMLGYRYWPWDKKFFLRAAYTPYIEWMYDFQWQHWFGLTIGYRTHNAR